MSTRRKICVVTGTRAEYGLMYWLLKAINNDPDLELQIVVTGMHLSPEFGLTYKKILEDGFIINKKIEILLSSDTTVGISKSMGLMQISAAEVLQDLDPDLLVVLGDRFEIFSIVSSAMISRIPIAHLHGGEATEGLIDEPIRHSITKMSHLHFTATKEYKKRVIQLGEEPHRVFNVGSPGIDNIVNLKLLSKGDFEKAVNFQLGKKNILVTFHPVTLENSTAKEQFGELLEVINSLSDTKVIFTKPNADTDGRIIIRMIDEFVEKNKERSCAFISLGQLRYLSALQYVDVVVGNSSSGITEVPSFKKATVNIGDRQKGRVRCKSIIDCTPTKASITKAISTAYSDDFQGELKDVKNPYGKGGASKKIKDIIKEIELEGLIKKAFFDLK